MKRFRRVSLRTLVSKSLGKITLGSTGNYLEKFMEMSRALLNILSVLHFLAKRKLLIKRERNKRE